MQGKTIGYVLGILGFLVAVAPDARAEPSRWGGGFGGGDRSGVEPIPSQSRWAAGWGGQSPGADQATGGSANLAAGWPAGWGGERTATTANRDLASARGRSHRRPGR